MKLTNIVKRYPGCTVFENFSLDIAEGQVTCLLGPSGAGKTTLLNILAGLTPCEGGVPKVGCSYIFQQPRLVPNLTVRGNLRLVCRDESAIAAMLNRVGLADRASAYPKTLSGGQARRVAIARAFLYPAPVVLMDEPFTSLDLALKLDMMNAFAAAREGDGRTAVFVTHDVDEAIYLADRIVVLAAGRVVLDRPNSRPAAFGAPSALREELVSCLLSLQ